ncbi:MAG: bifunctional 3,4-dihydroxy-2-butanone-4-phosphate synthase/GTP cyclohydrolase II [Pseudomonadota bacterium]
MSAIQPHPTSGGFHGTEELLAAMANGEMVIVLDDEDRENEGDLIMAADRVQAEDINFMARFGRGLICLTLTSDRCAQLRLPLMVSGTDTAGSTNFTLSIEAAEGVTTGISAYDRARTVAAAVAPNARPEDLRQPGHVFPIMAQPGGVLTRAGHTEAGCDLARLSGHSPAAVIVEILNEDGTMARRAELMKFAHEHGLKIGTIADLIRYRLDKEVSVERIDSRTIPTEQGDFLLHTYEDHVHRTVHLALVKGEPAAERPTLVRVHVQDTLSDVLGVQWSQLGWPLRAAMQRVSDEGEGVVIVLRGHNDPKRLVSELRQSSSPPPKASPHGTDDDHGPDNLRTYGIGAQILRDLNVRRMRVLSAPKDMRAISGFGLEVVEYLDEAGA